MLVYVVLLSMCARVPLLCGRWGSNPTTSGDITISSLSNSCKRIKLLVPSIWMRLNFIPNLSEWSCIFSVSILRVFGLTGLFWT